MAEVWAIERTKIYRAATIVCKLDERGIKERLMLGELNSSRISRQHYLRNNSTSL